jgi:hypothetical protein
MRLHVSTAYCQGLWGTRMGCHRRNHCKAKPSSFSRTPVALVLMHTQLHAAGNNGMPYGKGQLAVSRVCWRKVATLQADAATCAMFVPVWAPPECYVPDQLGQDLVEVHEVAAAACTAVRLSFSRKTTVHGSCCQQLLCASPREEETRTGLGQRFGAVALSATHCTVNTLFRTMFMLINIIRTLESKVACRYRKPRASREVQLHMLLQLPKMY